MPTHDLERLMWAEACEMLDRAERLHRRFFRPGRTTSKPVWEPPVDMYGASDGLWLVVAMPGANADSIEVRIENGDLVVRAERRLPAAARRGAMHRLEIPFGRFERRLSLPAGSYRLQEQEWLDGCLHLVLQYARER